VTRHEYLDGRLAPATVRAAVTVTPIPCAGPFGVLRSASRTGARRTVILAAVGCCVAAGTPAAMPAIAAAKEPPCSPGGGRTLARGSHVRILERRGSFYSCWLPTRRRRFLGHTGEPVPDRSAALDGGVSVDGEFAAFVMQALGDPGYDVSTVVSINVRTGRSREIEPPEIENSSLVEEVGVARDGAVVYVQLFGSPCPGLHQRPDTEQAPERAVIAVEPGAKRQTLDCELPSDPDHSIKELKVAGKTATWEHAGVLHTVTLR